MSRYMLVFCLGLTALLAEPTIAPERSQAGAQTRPRVPATATYQVYYYRFAQVRGRTQRMGPYTYYSGPSYASAIRALNYLNSFPNLRAYYRTRY